MDDFLGQLGVNVNVTFHLIFFSLVWVRVLMMASVLPFIFGKPLPKYVVVAVSMALAVFVYPAIVPSVPPPLPEELIVLVMLFVKEAFYGFIIGMSVAVIFHAFASVGQMIDNQRGMSIARILIPQLNQQGSLSGIFLFQLGIVLYLVGGGHLIFFNSFFMSFTVLPVMGFPSVGPGLYPLVDLFMNLTGEVIYIALQMSAPVIIAIFMADIILGIANRIAPQINVWMLGFTLKGYVGILLLFIAITMIGDQMIVYSKKANRYTDEAIRLMEGKVPEDAPQLISPEEGLPKSEEGVPKVESF